MGGAGMKRAEQGQDLGRKIKILDLSNTAGFTVD
jgi:hypothetical protein